jgi:hypothetical protein
MIRVLVVAATFAVALSIAGPVAAKLVPRDQLARDADAVCSLENGRLAQLKNPPSYSSAKDITAKRLKRWAPWFKRWAALKQDESKRISTLGTPSEQSAQVAWKRWKALIATVQVPAFAKAATAAGHGDVKAFTGAFGKPGQYDSEANKIAGALGFKVCSWDG